MNHSPNPAYASPEGEWLLQTMRSPTALRIDALAMDGKSVRECIELGYPFPPGIPLDLIVRKTGKTTYELVEAQDEHHDT